MSVFRVEKTNNYTVMSNYHFKEKNMSLKAKGLLSLMLSLPDCWDYSINGLAAICKENETSIKSALEELKEFGYLDVIKLLPNQTKSGRIEYEYIVYEQSKHNKKQEDKKQGVENLGVEFLGVENQGQLNTNILNTKKLNTKNLKENTKENFETFYKAYPKKIGKANVEKWFIKNNPDEKLFKLMMNKLELFKRSPDWLKDNGQFIPYPSTWLNQKRWEDEIYINGVPIQQEEQEEYIEIDTANMSEEEYIRTLKERRKKKEQKEI